MNGDDVDSGWGDDPYGDPAYGGGGFPGGVDWGDPDTLGGWWDKWGIGKIPTTPTIAIALGRAMWNDIQRGKEYSGSTKGMADFVDPDNPTDEELLRFGQTAIQGQGGGNPTFGEWWGGSSSNPNAQSTWVRPGDSGGQYQLNQPMRNPGYSGGLTWNTGQQTFPWMEGDPRYKAFQEGGWSYDPATGQIKQGGAGGTGGGGTGTETINQLPTFGTVQQYYQMYNRGQPGASGRPLSDEDYISLNTLGQQTTNPTAQEQGGASEVEAYFKRYPEAEAAYQAAVSINPNWTRDAWARANYEQRKNEGQDVVWGTEQGDLSNDVRLRDASGRAGPSDPYAGLNDKIWEMYNTGRGDIETGRDKGILDIQNAIASGRTDIANALLQARADIERGVATGRNDLSEYYGKSRADLLAGQEKGLGYYDPYVQAGTRSLGTLEGKMATGPGDFYTSPGYQFRLGEGIKAMERAASARGGTGALFDPRLYKEMQDYGQGMATNEYQNFLNNYYQSLTPYQQMVSGVGLPAAGASADIAYGTGQNLANIGMTTGSNLANLAFGGGQTLGGYGMTAGGNLANMGMQGGLQNALIRSNAGTSLAGLGQDAAKTAANNLLAKEGLGIDWSKLMLAESEAEKGRTWQGGQSELDRALAKEMAEKGYAFYNQQAGQNRNANFLNNLMLGGGFALGAFL